MTPISVLEGTCMMEVLLDIKRLQPCSKSAITKAGYGQERSRFIRIAQAEESGLVEVRRTGRQHNTMCLTLTPKGMAVASMLEAIEAIMDMEVV